MRGSLCCIMIVLLFLATRRVTLYFRLIFCKKLLILWLLFDIILLLCLYLYNKVPRWPGTQVKILSGHPASCHWAIRDTLASKCHKLEVSSSFSSKDMAFNNISVIYGHCQLNIAQWASQTKCKNHGVF